MPEDPNLKAVIFDIGGVVTRSPLLAIAAYEQETGLPKDYINCLIVRRGAQGAWQKFERGEIELLRFYDQFSRELSDTINGNQWYKEHCHKRGFQCPPLPTRLTIDGRELFGRMMREGKEVDKVVVEAIRRIKESRRYLVIALTNNYAKPAAGGGGRGGEAKTPGAELAFLGWTDDTHTRLRSMFDDYVDSSEAGMRKPEPQFYQHACTRNGVKPHQAVFLDDLGINLKAARELGMRTVHVPIGGTLEAMRELGELVGIDLISPEGLSSAKL